jgi:class 3 adenylate cyclase/tetratricopeptide (TPR) repeat protein
VALPYRVIRIALGDAAVQCPRCQTENREGRRFCGACGLSFAAPCPSCGFANEGHERYCGGCGRSVTGSLTTVEPRFSSPEAYTPKHLSDRILTSRAALEGERKQVTVVFADLKGSMELLADRDPEEARQILDPVLEHMMEAVHRYEGTVNQVMGDGIMALFGAPIAHEDHALRACYAALRMQESVKQYAAGARRSHGVEVQIRVGLNSGEVVVRSVGSDLRMDYTAIGQTTHLAARMEQLATPGTIRLTGDTLRLVEGFIEVTPLGPVPIKGVTKPVEVYEATGAGAVRTRLQAAVRRGLSPFIGRDAELEQLRRAQRRAGEGHGQVAAVVGEAGVGKSRLVYEFTHAHRLPGWLILEAGSVSYGKGTSYRPVVDLLKGYFKIPDRDDLREIREKVTGKLLTLDESLKPALPALLAWLDVPVDVDEWRALDPAERRRRMLDAATRLLVREAREQPVLLIVEDLHWIDTETQALLDGLVEGLDSARLLLLATYRPEYQHAWSDTTSYTQIRLNVLPVESAEALLHALLGTDLALAPLKRLLVERGNPFFLEETVRILVETNQLAGERGRYRLAGPIHGIQVPPTVQAVLAARIDRLAAEDKRLLQTASVIGKDLPLAILQEIAELPDEALRRGLDRLRAAEFVYEATLFPEVEYTFQHALTHEVAYGGLLHERRRALHARIVEAIERLYANRLAEHIERLADHAVRGEVWDKAVRYLREAVMRQAARSAYQEARTSFEAAVRALAHLPETRETKAQAIDLRLDSRVVLAPLGEYDGILEYMREAETMARELGDRHRLGLVLADMGARLRNVGDHRRALEASRHALGIANELGQRDLQIEAQYRLAQAHFAVGEFDRAIAIFLETIEALGADRALVVNRPPDGSPALPPRFFAAWPRAWLGLSLGHLGRFPEALTRAHEAVQIAESADHRHTLVESYNALGGVHLEWGHLDAAMRTFERGIALQGPQGAGDANLLSGLGYTYALSGRLAEALPLLEDSTRSETSISAMGLGVAIRSARLATTYRLAGRADEARRSAHRAVELATKHQERANRALALKVLADVTACDDAAGTISAAEHYTDSLALANELGMRPLVAHCRAGLGRLYRRGGQRREADQHFATAATMYSEMGMTYWVEEAARNMKERP